MKTYKIEYLPSYSDDLIEIVNYISEKLYNPSAAYKLIEDIDKAIKSRSYSLAAYNKYYICYKNYEGYFFRINVKNFSVFYTIENNTMLIHTVVYNRRNLKIRYN